MPLPPLLQRFLSLVRRYHNAAIFLGGFLFDVFTIKRIDAWTDLLLQFLYLAGLTLILFYQYREHQGLWRAGPRVERLWKYNTEVLHFFYGGLLSAYVVLYFKSSSGARAWVFFLLLIVLMVGNEMPQLRRLGHRLRLGLYAFCVASYFIYLVPILVGRMGGLVFAASLLLSAGAVWGVAKILARTEPEPRRARLQIFAPAGGVLLLIAALYAVKLIPPVPLSVQFAGIYHGVERTPDNRFLLKTPRPPWYRFWKKESRPFRARPGDSVVYFVRLYAPARFSHQVRLRWQLRQGRRYVTSDLIPLMVVGGRVDGFRGYAAKSNFEPGRWRVIAETEDGRAIGSISFKVVPDAETEERRWLELRDKG